MGTWSPYPRVTSSLDSWQEVLCVNPKINKEEGEKIDWGAGAATAKAHFQEPSKAKDKWVGTREGEDLAEPWRIGSDLRPF